MDVQTLLLRMKHDKRGDWLRAARGNFSQQEVADADARLSQSMVSRLERGDPSTPPEAVGWYLAALAMLGVRVEAKADPTTWSITGARAALARVRHKQDDLIDAYNDTDDRKKKRQLDTQLAELDGPAIQIVAPKNADIAVVPHPPSQGFGVSGVPVTIEAEATFAAQYPDYRQLRLLPWFVNTTPEDIAASYRQLFPQFTTWLCPVELALDVLAWRDGPAAYRATTAAPIMIMAGGPPDAHWSERGWHSIS